MRFFALTAALFLVAIATPARASVYLSAGYKLSTSHAGWQYIETRGVSGGISVDLGPYIRLGYTREDNNQILQGYEPPSVDASTGEALVQNVVYRKIHTVADSIDLQAILYAGQLVTPYLIGGAVKKHIITKDYDAATKSYKIYDDTGPIEPQGGMGIQILLNSSCSFTLQYIVSPGPLLVPGEKSKTVWDGAGSIGLKYKI